MAGENGNNANSASVEVEVEVEAELGNMADKLSWECHTREYKLSC